MTRPMLTHVGSLPFLDITTALEYTFRFDIPVLFSLPILDPNQFMGFDILHLLDIKSPLAKENEFELKEHFWESENKIKPYYQDEFLAKAKMKRVEKVKFQLIGPYTFYKLQQNSLQQTSFEKIASFLLIKYQDVLKTLTADISLFFCIDEPMLSSASFEEISLVKKFVQDLAKVEGAETAIHCCAKLTLEQLNHLEGIMLNLDTSLYDEAFIERHREFFRFPGIPLQGIKGDLSKICKDARYVSPSCGLALKEVDELAQGFLFDKSNYEKS